MQHDIREPQNDSDKTDSTTQGPNDHNNMGDAQ